MENLPISVVFRYTAHPSPVSNAVVYQPLYSDSRGKLKPRRKIKKRAGGRKLWTRSISNNRHYVEPFIPRLVFGGLPFLYRILYMTEKYTYGLCGVTGTRHLRN